MADHLLAFGPFRLDPATCELTRDGVRVPLQQQPARLLALFAHRSGELVTRDEIRRHLWEGTSVAFDDNINYAIRQIRVALGDSADSPAFIQTLPRRGYRFVADVHTSGSVTSAGHRLAPPGWLTRRFTVARRIGSMPRVPLLVSTGFAIGLALGVRLAPPRAEEALQAPRLAAAIADSLAPYEGWTRELSHWWTWVDAHLSGRAVNCPYRGFFALSRS